MKKGFTLIELLVVVLIIGILSAIALPQYTKAVEKARATEAVSIISTLEKATDRFVMENGYKTGYFLPAAGAMNPPLSLDIDIPCQGGESGCETKYFSYNDDKDGSAGSGYIIYAYRNSTNPYYILFSRQEAVGRWNRICGCGGECTSASLAVCKGLEAQGWTFDEEWDF